MTDESNSSVYGTGWHSVWRTLQKTLMMIFSVVSYITKIMFYIRCYPNEMTMVMNCDADAMNVGYSYVPNAILYRDSYINIGLS